MIKKINPPRIAHWLLKLLLRKEDTDHRLGDFEEVYQFIAGNTGLLRAKKWYWFQVIKSIPNLVNNSIYWSIAMLKNYLKIAIRNLYKNKLYSFINIFGLGVAIAVSIVGYINFQFSQSFDAFHEKADNIYMVNTYRLVNNGRMDLASSPTLLAPAIKENIPGVENFSRFARGGGFLRYNDKVFNESFYYVDENFFDIFTFPMIMGDKYALKDKNSIIVTDEIAHKYFGEENPIGKQIIVNPNNEKEYSFIIRGVIKKPSTQSSISLNVVLPYERQADMLGYNLESWNDWTSAAFIHTGENTSASIIEGQLQNYVQKTNGANPDFPINGFFLTQLPELSSNSRSLNGSPFRNGFTMAQILAPSIIAFLVLLLACFNFINTAIAYAVGRLKEIGIRKVIGGMRGQLIIQFLGENILLTFIALILGLFLAKPFLAFYASLFPEVHFTMNYSNNPELIGFIIGLIIFTAIAAGAYPAFYVSKFNPISIFQGKQKLGGTNRLIRVLLTLQFAISISAILSGLLFYKNSEFIENYDLGFDKEQVLVIPVKSYKDYELLKNTIRNNPDVLSIGASQHLMGRSWNSRDVEIEQAESRINTLNFGENYFETAGLTLIQGKQFDHNKKVDAGESVIVNETLMQAHGWSSPEGKYIKFRAPSPGKEYRVIGVVKDFHLTGLWDKVDPMAIRHASPESYRYLSVKFNLKNMKNVSEYMRNTWQKLFPHLPYDGFLQSEIIAETIQITEAIKLLFMYVAIIVIFTSGLGLFALVSLNIVKRTKEIGIRRVLGASFGNISYLISKEFIYLLLIAGVVGSLMGYFLIDALMSNIWVYYTAFGVLPFILSTLLLFVIAILTVSSQVFSVASSNPVDAIRYE